MTSSLFFTQLLNGLQLGILSFLLSVELALLRALTTVVFLTLKQGLYGWLVAREAGAD